MAGPTRHQRPTLHVFASATRADLRAFTITDSGVTLPEKFAPWSLESSIGASGAPPHGLSRAAIEKGIARDGFQLFRVATPN